MRYQGFMKLFGGMAMVAPVIDVQVRFEGPVAGAARMIAAICVHGH
jgi:hypothetical protein